MARVSGFRAYAAEDAAVAHGILRFTMGIDIFVHGAWRLPHLSRFVSATAQGFGSSGLPHPLTLAFLWAVPFIEIVLGALVTLGLGLRVVLPLAGLYFAVLIFGSTANGAYTAVVEQLGYALVLALLTAFRAVDDRWSLDALRERRRTERRAEV